MTEDDKRRQKEDLILEFHRSVENMKALRQQIKTVENNLAVVLEWAGKATRAIDKFDPDQQFWSKTISDNVDILGNPRFRNAFNFEKLAELLEQFSSALKRIEELRASKLELGITT